MKAKKILIAALTACLLCTVSCGTEKTEKNAVSSDDAKTEEQSASQATSSESEGQKAPEKTKEKENKQPSFIDTMSLEDKVAQMFVVVPDELTGVTGQYAAGRATQKAYDRIPVGGFILMKDNIRSVDQTKSLLSGLQDISQARVGLPVFTFTDEEGGSVRRVSGNLPGIPYIPDMADVGASGDVAKAAEYGKTMGKYLHDLGFTGDFAPVADVLTNPSNTVVKDRSFGSDPELVSKMSLAVAEGLEENKVTPVFKHFPGHGSTASDTHKGNAYTSKSLDELKKCDLIPFQDAIDNGAQFIMVSHISLPKVTGDDTPASLSSEIMTDLLRNDMGYKGIIITDAMGMGAVTKQYGNDESVVKAIEAGADLILSPVNLDSAYNAVLSAVKSGEISEDRINSSVKRILTAKGVK